MSKGPWDVKLEEIDTPTKLLAVIVVASAAGCLSWLILADNPLERGAAGLLLLVALLFVGWLLTNLSREPAPSTSVGDAMVQVAQTEVAEEHLADTRDKTAGPDATYYVDMPPEDWTVQILTMSQFVAEELGTNDEVIVRQSAGAWPDVQVLVMRSPSVATLTPKPGYTKSQGRPLAAALMMDIRLQFVVTPLIRAQPPLFVDSSLEESFLRAISPLLISGVVRLTRLDAGQVKTTGKQQWFAEFEQRLEDIDVNHKSAREVVIRHSYWAVEGNVQDYLLRLTHMEMVGAEADTLSRNMRILRGIAESFSSLAPIDKERELQQIREVADARYVDFFGQWVRAALTRELILAVTRFGGKDLSQPGVLLGALQQFEVFAQWNNRGELDLGDETGMQHEGFVDLFESLSEAREGNFSRLRASLESLVEEFFDEPHGNTPPGPSGVLA
jgi:hypothetical protein